MNSGKYQKPVFAHEPVCHYSCCQKRDPVKASYPTTRKRRVQRGFELGCANDH